ncbi:MAG: Pre-mRNA-splicing factor cwc26 [Peltula sp. TS41687]|nr:MAG: Pre-mRNA-splicing factor cwc26 [Peltula sp. TS41687]
MTLADYLAKNYLTADPSSSSADQKSKKRKRKPQGTDNGEGLIIADDDATIEWNDTSSRRNEAEDGPLLVSGQSSADFRRAKASSWRSIGAPAPSSSDQAAADAILASAAAENAARVAAEENDDNPAAVVLAAAPTTADTTAPKMSSGAHAGLQTAAQVAAAHAAHDAAERARFAASSDAQATQETIYRDASGRVINIAMKRAEARRAAEAAEASKQAALKAAQQGDVQQAEKAARRERLQEEKYAPLARAVDDEGLNEELKRVRRWDDPAAAFLSEKREGKSATGKPLYKGAAMPNRFGIRPGYRWDGVDRGNGFEKEWFAARNRRANVRELEFAWQMDE